MSKRYSREECATATKRKKSQRPLTSREDTGSRVITQSSEGHLLSAVQGATPNRLRNSVQQPPLARSGVSTTLIRSTSITDSKNKLVQEKQQAKKIGWGTILDEVGFLKQKISEIERPTFGRQPQPALPKQRSTCVDRTELIPKSQQKKVPPSSHLFGREYTMESIHLLYQQIVFLRNQNQLLKDSLRHAQEQLEYERKQSVKMARTMAALTNENEKIRNEFLSQGRKQEPNKRTLGDSGKLDKHSQALLMHQRSQQGERQAKSLRSYAGPPDPLPTVLQEITNRLSRQQTLSTYPSKHLSSPYDAQPVHKNSSEQNLLEEIEPHVIDRRLKELNEKFEILLFNSKYEKGKEGRMNIKEQLFTVTAQIKALQQQKALLTVLH